MKRQKRALSERAFARGYSAAMAGKSRSICPYEAGDARQTWLMGWREAREDHWDGFNTLAQVQKIANL